MECTIGATELRQKLTDVLQDVREQGRTYVIQTFGNADTVMVLFEAGDDGPTYIDGDDDSGWSRNARVGHRLYRGHEYILRVRLYYAQIGGQTAVFMY